MKKIIISLILLVISFIDSICVFNSINIKNSHSDVHEFKKEITTENMEVKNSDDEFLKSDVINGNNKKEVKEEKKDSKGVEKKAIDQVSEQKPKELSIWEKLGMSEYDYYNNPMYNWERIDFKSMNECLVYGDNYKPYLDGEVLYNCHDVFKYLW